MSGHGILDTNTLILLGRLTADEHLPDHALITTITLAELSVGPLLASTADERVARQAHLQAAEADFEPLPFDASAARSFGGVAASLRRAGRKPAARAYDALIAATAIANGIPVHTCNPGDFEGIEQLEVIPVPHPDSVEANTASQRGEPKALEALRRQLSSEAYAEYVASVEDPDLQTE